MTRSKSVLAALFVAAALVLATQAFAQLQTNIVGSSAQFNTITQAARLNAGGTHNYTKKKCVSSDVGNPGGVTIDGRSTSIAQVGGSLSLVWDDSPTPKVWAYLNVDSVVGVRSFLAVPKATLGVDPCVESEAGDNLVPGLPADEASVPTAVFNLVNGATFTAAATDIRPEDAKFATTRALTAVDTVHYNGLGYGPGPIGPTLVHSDGPSAATVQVVDFALQGTDPITGQTQAKFTTSSVGAAPIVIFVNKSDTAAGGFGNTYFTNANRFDLTRFFNGLSGRTRDLTNQNGLPSIATTTYIREPLSGTYNTFEFCIPRSVEINSSQEVGVTNPTGGSPFNPMHLVNAKNNSLRSRVVGTGEMVSQVNATADSLGYAFWSFGNFNPTKKIPNGKYLTLDGVDPIQTAYIDGSFPTCTYPCPGGPVNFAHIADGSYAAWSVLRVVSATPVPASLQTLLTAEQTQVANMPDFIPATSLNVFRAHYTQSGLGPRNGHIKGQAEQGGDMGGQIYNVQNDLDSITDTGKEITGVKQ